MTAVFITVYRQRTQPKIYEERSVQGQINQIIPGPDVCDIFATKTKRKDTEGAIEPVCNDIEVFSKRCSVHFYVP